MPTQSVTLAWDASTAPNVAGYQLYYGAASRSYTKKLNTGLSTSGKVDGLLPGVTYYFAVTALNASGLESDFSNEVRFTVPSTGPRLSTTLSSGTLRIAITGQPGQVCTIQTSTDAVHWSVLTGVTLDGSGQVSFTQPSTAERSRFYRVAP